jgi:hypothetical protein
MCSVRTNVLRPLPGSYRVFELSGGIAALNPRIAEPKLFMACGRSSLAQAQAQRAVNNSGARLNFGRSPGEFDPHSFEEF